MAALGVCARAFRQQHERRWEMEVQRSIEIDASPAEVWAFVADPAKILEWYTILRAFEYTTEQRCCVGAPFRFEEKVPIGTITLDCVVTQWQEPEVFAFSMTSGSMKSYAERWTLEPTPTGSRFTFREQGELPFGILSRLIQPLAERTSGATVEGMLATLKGLAEA
jgi:uncharacterized protein YndB with AHSA1/START domain